MTTPTDHAPSPRRAGSHASPRSVRVTASVLAALLVGFLGLIGTLAWPAGADTRQPNPKITTRIGAAAALTLRPVRTDSLFVPMTACRVMSTAATHTPLTARTSRAVSVRGSSGYAAQGGSPNGCGVPGAATAVVLQISTTSTTTLSNGTLMAYAGDATRPAAVSARVWKDRPDTTSVTATLGASGSGSPDLQVWASQGTNVDLDAVGYYEPQIEAYVAPDGSVYSSTPRVLGVNHTPGPGQNDYQVMVDTDVNACDVTATPGRTSGEVIALALTLNQTVDVHLYNVSTQPPTPVEGDFNVTVTC